MPSVITTVHGNFEINSKSGFAFSIRFPHEISPGTRRISSLLADAHLKFYDELRDYGKQDEYISYVSFLRKIRDSLAEHDQLKKEIMASIR